jgi:hypothetical protein
MKKRGALIVSAAVAAILLSIAFFVYFFRNRQPVAIVTPVEIPKPLKPVVHVRKRVRAVEKRDAAGDIVSAMEALVPSFERTRDWTIPVRLASVYENGSYPVFSSDQETARTLYMAVATMATNPIVASHARSKVVIALDPEDDAGRRLPPEPAAHMFRAMKRVSEMERMYAVERIEDPVVLFSMEPAVVYTDEQNVHDHGVIASLRKAVEKEKENENGAKTGAKAAGGGAKAAVLDAVANAGDLDDATKADAAAFLVDHVDAVEVKTVGTSPEDALKTVWKRIEDIEDPERRANAIETLARQMADGYNRGHAVCATGRVARILGALDGVVEDAQPMRPTWAIREEIGRLAAKCSNEGAGGDAFEQRAMQTYVRELGMSEGVVRPIVDEYKAYIDD